LEHGIEALSHPKELDNLYISIAVLSVSIILETYVLVKAVKKLRVNKEKKTIIKLLKESNDGPLIAIVVEDFAATLGLIFALIGTLLTYFTNNSIYDALSAISIGILLMFSGLFLGYEMKHLITGETVDNRVYKILEKTILNEEGIKGVVSIKVISIGTNNYLGIVKVDYLDVYTDLEIIELNKKIEEFVKTADSRFSHLYLIPA